MGNKIFSLLVLALLALGMPQAANAVPAIEIMENDFQSISIVVNRESVLRVTGAAGEVLSVYNITGVRVMCLKVDGADRSYTLNLPKGCYIIKVGKVVRKISIR